MNILEQNLTKFSTIRTKSHTKYFCVAESTQDIKEAIKLKSGSQEPGRNIVASITKKQLEEIAKQKMADLNAHNIDEASKIIAGSARSMGIEVKE